MTKNNYFCWWPILQQNLPTNYSEMIFTSKQLTVLFYYNFPVIIDRKLITATLVS